MLAMMCDRCGKLYEPYYKDNKNIKQGKTNGIHFGMTNVAGLNINRYKLDIFDLCPECMDKLLAFMFDEREGDKKCGAKVL